MQIMEKDLNWKHRLLFLNDKYDTGIFFKSYHYAKGHSLYPPTGCLGKLIAL